MKWLDILFSGAGVAIVAAIVAIAARYVARRRIQHTRYAKYFGKYQGYHLASSGSGSVIRSVLSIYLAPNGEPALYLDNHGPYDYGGRIRFLGNVIYFDLEGKHPELVRFVGQEPLRDSFEILAGVLSGVSEAWLPVCCKVVFVKVGAPEPPAELQPAQVDQRIYDFLRQPRNPIRVLPMEERTLDGLAESIEP